MDKHARTARRGPDRTVIAGVLVGVVLLLVASIVFIASGDDGDDTPPREYGIITSTGGALPPLPDSGDDPAVGMLAPSVISERSNEQIRLEPGEEPQPTMVVFLAHWCSRCQQELPLLIEMADAGAFDDIRTIGVLTSTTPDRGNYPPSTWLDREGWAGDRLFDDEESSTAVVFGLSEFPFVVFLDAEGNVVQRMAGEQSVEEIQEAIDAIVR